MTHNKNCIGYVCTCDREVTLAQQLFIVGNMIRHNSTLDVDLIIDKVLERNENYTALLVRYWNRNYNFVIDNSKREAVTIKKEDYQKWSMVGWL